ncbi:hypothetical protein L2095_25020 [Bacillus zanthoxyli]|nr:hypothetical protein [Bacillus zanthoxyli]
MDFTSVLLGTVGALTAAGVAITVSKQSNKNKVKQKGTNNQAIQGSTININSNNNSNNGEKNQENSNNA